MLYVKSEAGELVPITYEGVFAKCPGCGAVHQVDISEIMESCGGDVEDVNVYCEKCTKPHLPMFEHMEEIEAVAARFPGVSVGKVQEIVRSGLDHGFSIETALVGARLALAMHTGREELFSLDDVAAALGCTREEAADEMERHGFQGMTISTLPGFEWLLDKM